MSKMLAAILPMSLNDDTPERGAEGEMPARGVVMPRERITHADTKVRDAINGEWVEVPPAPQVSVVWFTSPEGGGWVQLLCDIDSRWLEQVMADRTSEDGHNLPLYTEVLSREECNKLVRVTRRARDKAYGADA